MVVHEKGVQDLLAAVPRLRRRHPGLRVVVAGTGPAEASLREQARSLRLASLPACHAPRLGCTWRDS